MTGSADQRATPDTAALSQALLETMTEAVYVVDRDRTITYWNAAAERVTGYSAAEVVGRRCRDGILNHVDEAGARLCGARCPLLATMRGGQVSRAAVFLHHRNGHRVPVELSAAALRDADGRVTGAVEVFHDDSRYRSVAAQLTAAEGAALTDPLTGVGNRRMLDQALLRYESELGRYGRQFAVLFADLDHFKSVNDTYGHDVGDQVLQLVAATLRQCIRPSDTLGRWGGEEFLVLAPLSRDGEAVQLAERLRILVESAWVDVDGSREVHVTLSMGVAESRDGDSASAVVARADAAAYRAKALGRNRTVAG